MKSPVLRLALALLPALWPLAGVTQTDAAPPAPAASAAPKATVVKPLTPLPPKQMNAADSSANAATPGDRRPEHQVVPQISIPLGRTEPEQTEPGPRTGQKPSTGGGIDDSLARCMAMEDEQARAMCRERLGSTSSSGR
jgi:hypothetical protein